MKRIAVYCERSQHQDIYNQTIQTANKLRQAGIQNVRALPMRGEIRTSRVKIFIINDNPDKLKALKIEERFGFPGKAFQSGGLVNYILGEERRK